MIYSGKVMDLILNSSGFLSMTSIQKAFIRDSGLRKTGPSGKFSSSYIVKIKSLRKNKYYRDKHH